MLSYSHPTRFIRYVLVIINNIKLTLQHSITKHETQVEKKRSKRRFTNILTETAYFKPYNFFDK